MRFKSASKTSAGTPLIILICVLAVCAFGGLLGMIGKIAEPGKPDGTTAQPSKPDPSVSKETPVIRSLVSTDTINSSTDTKNSVETKDTKPENEKSALVITKNANLRESADNNSEIIQTIGGGEEIRVIRQKGAWFYVLYSGQKGWMHGNTIKYKNAVPSKLPENSTATVSRPDAVYKAPERSVNPTGATARCRDGTLSYSAHRRGTCSHHGGVAVWY